MRNQDLITEKSFDDSPFQTVGEGVSGIDKFKELINFAHDPDGLDMTKSGARDWAYSNIDNENF